MADAERERVAVALALSAGGFFLSTTAAAEVVDGAGGDHGQPVVGSADTGRGEGDTE